MTRRLHEIDTTPINQFRLGVSALAGFGLGVSGGIEIGSDNTGPGLAALAIGSPCILGLSRL